MMTSPISEWEVYSLFYNADALFRDVFSQSEKLQITAVPVIGTLGNFSASIGKAKSKKTDS